MHINGKPWQCSLLDCYYQTTGHWCQWQMSVLIILAAEILGCKQCKTCIVLCWVCLYWLSHIWDSNGVKKTQKSLPLGRLGAQSKAQGILVIVRVAIIFHIVTSYQKKHTYLLNKLNWCAWYSSAPIIWVMLYLLRGEDSLNKGHSVGSGLSWTSTSSCQKILPIKSQWNGFFLNEGRSGPSEVSYRLPKHTVIKINIQNQNILLYLKGHMIHLNLWYAK